MKKGFRRWITDNLKLKLISIAIAVMLWFTISQMGDSKMSISVRVVPKGLPRELILKTVDPDYVLVTVNGPVSALKNLKAKDLAVSLDLASVREGNQGYSLQAADITIPKGIKVEDINPDHILLDVDRVLEKRLKVVVKLDHKWADVYRVRSSTPTYVTVEGAAHALKHIGSIETVVIDGAFNRDEEVHDAGLQLEGLYARTVRPASVRVTLRRQ
jgi:YbbR domain-containing protein